MVAMAEDLPAPLEGLAGGTLRKLPLPRCQFERPDWVGTRRATFLVRRRKPAAQVSHPESCRTPSSAADPERSLRLPQSCRSGTQGFHEFRCSEAAVRDLTHPAISRPS